MPPGERRQRADLASWASAAAPRKPDSEVSRLAGSSGRRAAATGSPLRERRDGREEQNNPELRPARLRPRVDMEQETPWQYLEQGEGMLVSAQPPENGACEDGEPRVHSAPSLFS